MMDPPGMGLQHPAAAKAMRIDFTDLFDESYLFEEEGLFITPHYQIWSTMASAQEAEDVLAKAMSICPDTEFYPVIIWDL